jgi:hypothetical protein
MTTTQRWFLQWADEELGLCACGSDGPHQVIQEVLERCSLWSTKSLPTWARRHLRLDYPMRDASGRWVELVAKMLDSKGFLEHGSSIGGSWLTICGKALLAVLQRGAFADEECLRLLPEEYEAYQVFAKDEAAIDSAAWEWAQMEPEA